MTPQIIDLTAQAPAEYRVRIRPASEVRALVLHQTGFAWRPDNPRWPLVKAHFVVRQDGSVVIGKFQDSCRLVIQARYALDFEDALSYSGLRQTTRMGSQLRVFPDQRSGWRRRAAS